LLLTELISSSSILSEYTCC